MRPANESSTFERKIEIESGPAQLEGDLLIPPDAQGLVIFAHGSGSSRFSPRNKQVATVLNRAGLATLLMDLLTPEEEEVDQTTRHLRFDIPFLAQRVGSAIEWASEYPRTHRLSIGLFGASTGAAAALAAAAHRPRMVKAVVSRGGRPDLAERALPRIHCPTLLIVGGEDTAVIDYNEEAFDLLECIKRLEIVPGATHLFEEPGAMEHVADLTARWFVEQLAT